MQYQYLNLKKHLFYHENIGANDFIERLKNIRKDDIFDILKEIPEQWLLQIDSKTVSNKLRTLISYRLIDQINKAEILSNRLEALKNIRAETEKERKSRIRNNRKAFHKKHGLL